MTCEHCRNSREKDDKIRDLETMLQQLKEDFLHNLRVLDLRDEELHNLDSDISKYKVEQSETRNLVSELKIENAQIQTRLKDVIKDNDILRARLHDEVATLQHKNAEEQRYYEQQLDNNRKAFEQTITTLRDKILLSEEALETARRESSRRLDQVLSQNAEHYETRITELRGDISKENNRVFHLENELSHLKHNYETERNKNEALERMLHDMKVSKEEAIAKHSRIHENLAKDINKIESETKNTIKVMQLDRRKQVDELQTRLVEFENEKINNDHLISTLRHENELNLKKQTKLIDQLKSKEEELLEKNQLTNDLKKSISQYRKDYHNLINDKISQLTEESLKKYHSLVVKTEELERQKDSLQDDLKVYKLKHEADKERLSTYKSKCNDLLEEMNNYEGLKRRYEDMRNSFGDYQKKYREISKENEEIKSKNSRLKKAVDTMKDEMKFVVDHQSRNEERELTFETTVSKVRTENQKLLDEREKLLELLDVYKSQNDRFVMKEKMNATHASVEYANNGVSSTAWNHKLRGNLAMSMLINEKTYVKS
ncbi:hypothetical protein PCE1_000849 [Barthelona sp. PCE]